MSSPGGPPATAARGDGHALPPISGSPRRTLSDMKMATSSGKRLAREDSIWSLMPVPEPSSLTPRLAGSARTGLSKSPGSEKVGLPSSSAAAAGGVAAIAEEEEDADEAKSAAPVPPLRRLTLGALPGLALGLSSVGNTLTEEAMASAAAAAGSGDAADGSFPGVSARRGSQHRGRAAELRHKLLKILPGRRWSAMRDRGSLLMDSKPALALIYALVVLDLVLFVVALSLDLDAPWLDAVEMAILACYVAEILLKLLFNGMAYFSRWMNIFDFGVVLMSLVTVVVGSLASRQLQAARAARLLRPVSRGMRLLRIAVKAFSVGNNRVAPVSAISSLPEFPSDVLFSIMRRLEGGRPLTVEQRTKLGRLVVALSDNEIFRPQFRELDPDHRDWLKQDYGVVEMSDGKSRRRSALMAARAPSLRRVASSDSDLFVDKKSITKELSGRSGFTDAIAESLSSIRCWDWNVFRLAKLSAGSPLSLLAYAVMREPAYDLFGEFVIKRSALKLFLQAVEEGYMNQPYHNRRHAADVLHATHFFLLTGMLDYIGSLEVLGLLLAAMVHDIGHPGRTNDFLISVESELAMCYNHTSVLEQFHLYTAFRIMRGSSCNFLTRMRRETRLKLRQCIIELVMGTDMKQHFEIVADFKAKFSTGFDPLVEVHRKALMRMCLKVADVSHPCKPLELHLRWTSCIQAEFREQGREEAILGLPVSPLCQPSLKPAKSQLGFFSFIVSPMVDAWVLFLADAPEAKLLVDNLAANYEYWQKQLNEPSKPPASTGSAESLPTTLRDSHELEMVTVHGATPEGSEGTSPDSGSSSGS